MMEVPFAATATAATHSSDITDFPPACKKRRLSSESDNCHTTQSHVYCCPSTSTQEAMYYYHKPTTSSSYAPTVVGDQCTLKTDSVQQPQHQLETPEPVRVLLKQQATRALSFDGTAAVGGYPVSNSARATLTEWLEDVCEESVLSAITLHSAVSLMDRLFRTISVGLDKYQLVATVALLIAAKFEEVEDNVPSVSKFSELTAGTYTPATIMRFEILALNALGWRTMSITPAHFMGLFTTDSSFDSNATHNGAPLTPAKRCHLVDYSKFFNDLWMQDLALLDVKPSIIAASAIAAARSVLQIEPVWNKELAALTSHTESETQPFVEYFKAKYFAAQHR